MTNPDEVLTMLRWLESVVFCLGRFLHSTLLVGSVVFTVGVLFSHLAVQVVPWLKEPLIQVLQQRTPQQDLLTNVQTQNSVNALSTGSQLGSLIPIFGAPLGAVWSLWVTWSVETDTESSK